MTEKKQPKPKEETVLIKDLSLQQKIHLAIGKCADVRKKQTGMGFAAGSYNDVQQVVKEACQFARLNITPRCSYIIEDSNEVKMMTAQVGLVITDIDNVFKDEQGYSRHETLIMGDIKVPQVLKGNQNDAKTSGSLFSYGYKYLLQKFFLLNIEESQDLDFEQQGPSNDKPTDGFNLTNLK